MSRKIALNLTAILVGLVVSLVFLEVALRIYNPIVQTIKGNKVVLHKNYDETRKNTYIPFRKDTQIPGVVPESHIHQNSLGFRGADPPTDFTDWLTIIAVGGSTTRSATQSDDETWTALLGKSLDNCLDHTWINNAGFEGHTTFAHIDLIRNHVNKLHPKVVLMLIGANEIFLGPNAHDQEQAGDGTNLHMRIRRLLSALAARFEVINLGLTLYRSYRAWNFGLNWPDLAEREEMPSAIEAHLAVARELQSDYAQRLRVIIRLLRDGQTIPVLMTQPTLGGIGLDPSTGKDLSRLWHAQNFYPALDI